MSKELQSDHDLRALGIRVLFLAGEYVPQTRREELESIWGCSVRTHYGLTEMGLGVAVECDDGDGFHFNEADLSLEIIQPETGQRVLPGVEGELVFTTLTRQAMPLIRYRTRDISSFIDKPCRCGAASLKKIAAVKKRIDAIVKLGNGSELYPTLIDERLCALGEVLDYTAKLSRENFRERLELTVEVEEGSRELQGRIQTALHQIPALANSMSEGCMDAPVIRMVPRGHLKPAERAKKLILDAR
jgi:phenylacetate-CoA ligase